MTSFVCPPNPHDQAIEDSQRRRFDALVNDYHRRVIAVKQFIDEEDWKEAHRLIDECAALRLRINTFYSEGR